MPRLTAPLVADGAMRARPQPILRVADQLVLRPWRLGDVDAVVAAYADREIQQWNLQTLDTSEAETWIRKWDKTWATETEACWAITAASSGSILGRVALRDIRLAAGLAQITYWILPAARGHGTASAAALEISRWALDDLGLHRLELLHSVRNLRSCRVAEKAAFRLEGTLRSALLHPDGWHDMHLHAHIHQEVSSR